MNEYIKYPLPAKSKHKFTLVDANKVDSIKSYRLTVDTSGYVRARRKGIDTGLHRLLTDCPDGLVVDHINFDKLDNRLCNLRICTKAQNVWHQRLSMANTSGYKGVSYSKQKKMWVSYIKYQGKRMHIGYFRDIHDAAEAYRLKAKELFGEYAYV